MAKQEGKIIMAFSTKDKRVPKKTTDHFINESSDDRKEIVGRMCRIAHKQSIAKDYEVDDTFVPWHESESIFSIRSFPCLIKALEAGKAEIEVTGWMNHNKTMKLVKMNTKEFLECVKQTDNKKPMLEYDAFSYDGETSHDKTLGSDFSTLLGGPFHKNLYLHDVMKMMMSSFFAFHHDGTAKRFVNMMVEFIYGKGFRVDIKSDNPEAQALWESFCEANDLEDILENGLRDKIINGEELIHWLPNNETTWYSKEVPSTERTTGIIPRIRLVDCSTIWDFISRPEDQKPIAFQQVFPTQYQLYTKDDKTGKSERGSKFIYQQIPADECQYYRVNRVHNEKRGRSLLFAALGDMKRLRDAIDYALTSFKKVAAWSEDISVDGPPEVLGQIYAEIEAMKNSDGEFPAGSAFIHSDKIKREFLSTAQSGQIPAELFNWVLDKISITLGIPVNYWGTHLSGGQTQASTITATEPVVKMFEFAQKKEEKKIREIARRFFKTQNIDATIEVTFPEIFSSDRTKKIDQISVGESEGYISKKRAASMYAKEMQISDYDYEQEKLDIEKEKEDRSVDNDDLIDVPEKKQDDSLDVSGVGNEKKGELKDDYR